MNDLPVTIGLILAVFVSSLLKFRSVNPQLIQKSISSITTAAATPNGNGNGHYQTVLKLKDQADTMRDNRIDDNARRMQTTSDQVLLLERRLDLQAQEFVMFRARYETERKEDRERLDYLTELATSILKKVEDKAA